MTDYTIAIKKETPVWNLYQKLKTDGVQDADLDTGYPETNYVKKTRKIVQQSDRKIEETEVLNYALEHYERYQLAIKETTGYVVPWSLDDLNPDTHFDETIRDNVDRTITDLKQLLIGKGLEDGTDRFNELLAVSLYAFAQAPRAAAGTNVVIPKKIRQQLEKEGFKEAVKYLTRCGGLGFSETKADCETEATSLEALDRNCGACTEGTKILFGVFTRAGLNTRSLLVIFGFDFNKKIPAAAGTRHNSVELALNGKTRIFDMTLMDADAEPYYKKNKLYWWTEHSASSFLASHYSNLGGSYAKQGNPSSAIPYFKTAVEIDPRCASAYAGLSLAYYTRRDFGQSIEAGKTAAAIEPKLAPVYFLLGSSYAVKGETDLAIDAYKEGLKVHPKFAEGFLNLGKLYLAKAEEQLEENPVAALELIETAGKQLIQAYKLGASIDRKLLSIMNDMVRSAKLRISIRTGGR